MHCVYMSVYMHRCVSTKAHMWVITGKLSGVGSLLPPCGTQRSNSLCQAYEQHLSSWTVSYAAWGFLTAEATSFGTRRTRYSLKLWTATNPPLDFCCLMFCLSSKKGSWWCPAIAQSFLLLPPSPGYSLSNVPIGAWAQLGSVWLERGRKCWL